jgi:PD-(D/E)XK endonuclease
MTNRGMDIKNPKQRGEWAEMCFMARAAAHGLCVTKPYGDSAQYDFIIEHQGHFLRVQVKSTKRKRKDHYCCNVLTSCKPYKLSQIDFVAAYVIPLDIWYIIPVRAFCGRWYIHLSPDLKSSKYGQYREAWDLLRAKPPRSRAAGAGR